MMDHLAQTIYKMLKSIDILKIEAYIKVHESFPFVAPALSTGAFFIAPPINIIYIQT